MRLRPTEPSDRKRRTPAPGAKHPNTNPKTNQNANLKGQSAKQTAMNLTELKQKPIAQLLEIANEMGLEKVARSRKQDII